MTTHKPTLSMFFGLATAGLLALTGCGDDGGSSAGETETGTESSATAPTSVTDASSATVSTTDPDSATDDSSGSSGEEESGTDTGTAQTLLDRVLAALGGKEQLDALSGVRLETTVDRFIPGESPNPGDPAALSSTADITISLDVDTGSVRNEISRTPLFFPAPAPFEVTEIAAAGEGGWVDGVESIFGAPAAADMLSDRFASTLEQARLLNPHVLLARLSLDPSGSHEAGTGELDGTTYDLLEIDADVYPITLWVDPATDLVRRLTTRENSHMHRDVDLEVRYDDWQDTAAGVLFPGSVQLYLAGELLHDEVRDAIDTDPGFDADTFALPEGAAATIDPVEFARGERNHQHNQIFVGLGIPIDGLQLSVVDDEPVPGVHVLTGGSHHSIVIEQADGLVLLETPLYAQRCEAILEWAQTELPGQPFTHVVVSHHHDDHAACARVMVAAGAALVVDEISEAYFEEVLAAPSTIEPDALEDNPVTDPEILTVATDGSLILDDPTRPVVVYDLPNTHANDLVLPFLPATGVAYIADLYNPGFGVGDPTGPGAILDAFAMHGITDDVQLIVGAHGFGYATLQDLQDAAGG